jgi:hypothetical protein
VVHLYLTRPLHVVLGVIETNPLHQLLVTYHAFLMWYNRGHDVAGVYKHESGPGP